MCYVTRGMGGGKEALASAGKPLPPDRQKGAVRHSVKQGWRRTRKHRTPSLYVLVESMNI